MTAPASTAGDAYEEALLHVCNMNRAFADLLKSRAALHYSNASDHEAKTGKLAHKDRATAAEVQYLSQQFERMLR